MVNPAVDKHVHRRSGAGRSSGSPSVRMGWQLSPNGSRHRPFGRFSAPRIRTVCLHTTGNWNWNRTGLTCTTWMARVTVGGGGQLQPTSQRMPRTAWPGGRLEDLVGLVRRGRLQPRLCIQCPWPGACHRQWTKRGAAGQDLGGGPTHIGTHAAHWHSSVLLWVQTLNNAGSFQCDATPRNLGPPRHGTNRARNSNRMGREVRLSILIPRKLP